MLAKKALPRLDLPKVITLATAVLMSRLRWHSSAATQSHRNPPQRRGCSSLQVRRNQCIEIVPLSTGCLGACTYCKTKHARGELGSYSMQALDERVRQAAADPLVCQLAWTNLADKHWPNFL